MKRVIFVFVSIIIAGCGDPNYNGPYVEAETQPKLHPPVQQNYTSADFIPYK